jgi:transcriptional regulator with PAS, ATPase and Fis domain
MSGTKASAVRPGVSKYPRPTPTPPTHNSPRTPSGIAEKKFIQTALGQTNGNQSKAAEVLGVHRNTLSRKIGIHKLNGKK